MFGKTKFFSLTSSGTSFYGGKKIIKFCFLSILINFILIGIQKAKKKMENNENSQKGLKSTFVASRR